MSFDLGQILQQYSGGQPSVSDQDASAHFGKIAEVAPPGMVQDGLSAMMRSDQTPSVGEMASQTYQHSSPVQQAGMLNQILSGLSPAAIGAILGSLQGHGGAGAGNAPRPTTEVSEAGPGLGGLIGSVLGSLGGGGATAGGGLGGLGAILSQLGLGGGNDGVTGAPGQPPTVTPDQASQITPDQVKVIANKAEEHNPGIVDVLSGFYVQHPELVKSLGAAALALAMGHMARRT